MAGRVLGGAKIPWNAPGRPSPGNSRFFPGITKLLGSGFYSESVKVTFPHRSRKMMALTAMPQHSKEMT